MEVLIDGDIYIKIKPSPYDNEEDSKALIQLLERTAEKNNGEYVGILTPKPDYYDMDLFYELNTYGEMISWDDLGRKIKRKLNKKSMHEYIRLIDFLKEAQFIGKIFKRTEELNKDLKYTDPVEQNYCTVLYKTEYAILIEETFLGKKTLRMMDKKYFIDGNYTFIGETNTKYEDKKILYQAILNQIEQFKKRGEETDNLFKTK